MQKFYEDDSRDAIKTITEKYGPVIDWKTEYGLQPFTDMHMSVDLPAQNGLSNASNPMYSYILSGIAIFYSSHRLYQFRESYSSTFHKKSKRNRDPKVVGGERGQLIAQFLGESFLLCLFAFVLAVILVQVVLPVFNELSNKGISHLLSFFDAETDWLLYPSFRAYGIIGCLILRWYFQDIILYKLYVVVSHLQEKIIYRNHW